MHSIDLNCDLGESFGAYTIGLDETVTPHVTSVNIACGWHAGDPLVMERTVALAWRSWDTLPLAARRFAEFVLKRAPSVLAQLPREGIAADKWG